MMKFWLVALIAWGSINMAEAQKKTTHKKVVARKTISKKKGPSKKTASKAKTLASKPTAIKAANPKPPYLNPKQQAELKRATAAKEEILKADELTFNGKFPEALLIYEKYKDTPYMGANAFKNMGICYRSVGKGVTTNLSLAKSYFEKSATMDNNADACLALGQLLLFSGSGLTRNPALASEYLNKAARQGNKEADYELGRLYLVGAENLEKDEVKALQLLEAAGEGGNSDAQWLLGNTYSKGSAGVPKNMTKAKYWYAKYKEHPSHKKGTDL